MHKAASDFEGLDGSAADLPHLGCEVLDNVVDGVVVRVDDIHDGLRRDVAAFKQRFALGVDDGVIGAHMAVDELLHNVDIIVLGVDKELQLVVVLQPVGVVRAHAVVGLDNDGVADLVSKLACVVKAAHQMIARGLDTRLGVVGFHGGLQLDARHVAGVEARRDMELGTQRRISFEPVFVVRFQPVDLAIFVGEKRHGAKYLVIVFEVRDLVVFIQRFAQLLRQFRIRAVTDTKHAHAIFLQFIAELPVVFWKIRRNKNKVLHRFSLSCFCFFSVRGSWMIARQIICGT